MERRGFGLLYRKQRACLAFARTFLSIRLQFPFSLLTSVHVRMYVRVYVHMDANKPSSRGLCVQYTLFMVATSTSLPLLFSLSLCLSLDLLRFLLPLKSDLTPFLLKDHSSKLGNQMAFIQYVCRNRCQCEEVCLSRHFRSYRQVDRRRRKRVSCKTRIS